MYLNVSISSYQSVNGDSYQCVRMTAIGNGTENIISRILEREREREREGGGKTKREAGK